MRRRPPEFIRGERGSVVVIAVTLMALMLTFGLAAFAYVDQETASGTRERLNESAYNLAEGVMANQIAILSRDWPGAPTTAYPSVCTHDSTEVHCPDPTAVRETFNSRDYGEGAQWMVAVRDNDGEFYDDDSAYSAPTYDAGGDNKLWVVVETQTDVANRGPEGEELPGRPRVLIALVAIDTVQEPVPHSTVIAQAIATSAFLGGGDKPVICTKLPDAAAGGDCSSSSTQQGPVQLRCDELVAATCIGLLASESKVQPYDVRFGYGGGSGLSPPELDRLRARAVANGTYYSSGCPSAAGAVVYIASADCAYSGAGEVNSAAEPGVLIVDSGTVSFGGTLTYHGLVYARNRQASVLPVVSVAGSAQIRGSVQVDTTGQLSAASNRVSVVYDHRIWPSVASYGVARMVRASFRELVPRRRGAGGSSPWPALPD